MRDSRRKKSQFKVGELVTLVDSEPTYRVMFSSKDGGVGWDNLERVLDNPSPAIVLENEFVEWFLGQGTEDWFLKVLTHNGVGWVPARNVHKRKR